MSWASTIAVTSAGFLDSLGPLATTPNLISLALALLGSVFIYFAGSKAQREAIAKTTKETVESLSDGIRAATLRADAEEKRADAETLRAESEKKRADDEAARANAVETFAETETHRADAEKMRADAQTARSSALEIKNAELLNSNTADQTRFLATIKVLGKRNVELEAEVATLKAQLEAQG